MPDVLIIGAGPAGSVAAMALARRGWHVTLIEQHTFPRDKVCGECVSALGVEVLTRLGVAPVLQELQPIILTQALVHAPNGDSVRIPLPRPMWGLSREAMDTALLNLARVAGATVRQPARVERIDAGVEHGKAPTVHFRDLTRNVGESIEADWVLLADGKATLLPDRPKRTTDFGIKAHFSGINGPRNAIELFGVHGHYGGVAPVEHGRWNVAFSVPAALLELFRGDLDALFSSLTTQNRTLASRFESANRCADWLASPLPRFPVARVWPARIMPIGNAAAAVEPIGGEGMGLAMRSAELAAEFLDRGPATTASVTAIRTAFDHLWRVRRVACRAAARLVSKPALADSIVALLGANETLAHRALGWLGKTQPS